MSGFNFGTPASTGTSSGSLFGSANNTGNAGGSIFGKNTAAGSGSTGFSFGGGFNPTPSSDGGENQTATSTNQPFGTPARSSSPNTTAPSLFGSTTPAASGTNNLFSFGNPSTTPAGPPPTTSGFGASTGGASIFGASKPAQESSKPFTGFSLNNQTTSSGPSISTTPQPAPEAGGSIFKFPAAPKPQNEISNSNQNPPPSTTSDSSKPFLGFGQPPSSTGTATTSSSMPSFFTQPNAEKPTTSLFSPQPGAPSTQPKDNVSNMFAKVNTSSESTSKPAFSFSSSTATSTTSGAQKPLFGGLGATSTPPSTSGSLFSPPVSSQASATPATTSAAPKSLFTGFGAPPAAESTSKPLFGQATTSAAPSAPASSTATAPSTATKPFSFGNVGSTGASQPSTTATAPAPTLSLSGPNAGQPSVSTPAAVSTSGPAAPAQSRLRNKTMDEILTRWATDLTKYSKDFRSHAETVAKWDQIIVDNSSKIDKLYVQTRTCEKQTMSVDVQLTAIENQQAELESWLTKYENEVDEMIAKDGTNPNELGGPDQERERTYKLAERLGDRLDDMGRDLESMVEEINTANATLNRNGKADEPITQIVKILNSHLSQLQAIDQGTASLQTKLTAAHKSASSLGFTTNGHHGENGAAVEDFYRSYMGRR